jgi:hypothetical protein
LPVGRTEGAEGGSKRAYLVLPRNPRGPRPADSPVPRIAEEGVSQQRHGPTLISDISRFHRLVHPP